MIKGNRGILILISILTVISLAALGINYFKFMNVSEEKTKTFVPSLYSKTIDDINYEMTDNYLNIRNYENKTTLYDDQDKELNNGKNNNITIYLDFGCSHCKRLFLGNLSTVEKLLKQEDNIGFDFVILNYFGAKSTTNWSENSASIMALIANNYPEYFLKASKTFFQLQPDKINGKNISMRESINIVKNNVGVNFTDEEVRDLNNGVYLRWVNENVNKYASKKNISVLPTVLVNDELLSDPAIETPQKLENFINAE